MHRGIRPPAVAPVLLRAAGKPLQMMLYPNLTYADCGGNTQVHLFNLIPQFVKENP